MVARCQKLRTLAERPARGGVEAARPIRADHRANRHEPRAQVDEFSEERLLDDAVNGLGRADPDASASRPAAPWIGWSFAAIGLLIVVEFIIGSRIALTALFGLSTLLSFAMLALRLMSFRELALPAAAAGVPVTPDPLPVFTILVPLYHEAAVVRQLLTALDAIDYPKQRLDILLIVEVSDAETAGAIACADPGPHVRTIVVPDGQPRTKPRALNYGMAFARGQFVVVFDAEDQPEPDQLTKALAAFRAGPPELGCVQARLNIYNPSDSWLTRQFTIEYTAQFDGLLPAVERARLPILLGGTSNYFRREALDAVHGWDPFNVTEDADLGLRLARAGYQVLVLDSTTWEEAPSRFGVWYGQRTRWLKGWMQTWLVHMRRPRRLWRELGARRFFGFQAQTGGVILSALVHPLFLAIVAIDAAAGTLFTSGDGIGAAILRWMALLNLIASYGVTMALGGAAVAARGRARLAIHAVLLPVYWLAISFAAYRALWQLFRAPYYWEKTMHNTRAAASPSTRRQ